MTRVWVRSEAFINGAINYPISNHINGNTLRKTVNYAKNKGASGYPKIEYSIWRYIACNKINIPENIAWMYYETFFLVTNVSNDKRIEFDQLMYKCTTQEEIEKLKETLKIDLLQFVLLLYIQQFYSVDLRSSFVTREDWPSSRDLNDKRKSKGLDDINHFNFIKKNLDELFNLFMDKTNDSISDEILQAFNLLFDGSVNNLQSVLPFNSFIKNSVVIEKFDGGKITLNNLLTFMKTALEVNPFEVQSTLSFGKRVSMSYSGGSTDPRKVGKIITNSNYAPKSDLVAIITQAVKQTIIENSDTFKECNLNINRCVYSNIYVLAPIKSCTIKKCRKTILLIGAVERTLTIDGCVECTIISVCRRLIIKNSSMCTFHLLTPLNPIILSGCDNIRLAPYNSSYPRIEKHASQCGLSQLLNNWNKPIVVIPNQMSSTGVHWLPLPVEEFHLFTVPVDVANTKYSVSNLYSKNHSGYFGKMPPEYEQAIKNQSKTFEDNHKLIQNADLNSEQRLLMQKYIENSFKDWLTQTGNNRQLEQLSIINTTSTSASLQSLNSNKN